MKLVFFAFFISFICVVFDTREAKVGASNNDSEQMLVALDSFKSYLEKRWSYHFANNANYKEPISNLLKKIKSGLSVDEFGVEIEKIIALGIDGHSRVHGYNWPAGRCLPFLVESEGNRFIALNPDRKSFLHSDFPFLTKIDGLPIEEWCRQISVRVPKGSPQWVKHRCIVRFLGRLDYWRRVMNLPRKDSVTVELTNISGTGVSEIKLAVALSPPSFGVWPRSVSTMLAGNVGYLRLPNMQKGSSINEIKLWLPKFRNANGLIIDVRDNDGGDRDALNLIYSFLASASDPPRVFTAGAYRLHPSRKKDHLAAGHFMFTADYEGWTLEDKAAIKSFKKSFHPQWDLPEGQFSEWHYMVLRRASGAEIYHFDRPVVVLMNAKCFSATDIFLAGLKGMKNITLLGSPSGGGSGGSETFNLGSTGIQVTLSSMASFQSNGKLFDGNGVAPDKLLYHVPEYFIGVRDNVLEEALKIVADNRK
jgi:hypothetical protein